jgi:hypothetical protein
MPTIDAAEASLINDVEFLGELETFEPRPRLAPERALETRASAPTYDDLDAGLEVMTGAETFADPASEDTPVFEPHDDPYPASQASPVSGERAIPFATAAVVLVACLTAGAATAAFVFQDRLMQITAPRASR